MHLAAVKIYDYMQEHRLTDEAFADKIGASKHAVRKYKSGTRRARPDLLLKIKQVTKGKIEEADWYKDSK